MNQQKRYFLIEHNCGGKIIIDIDTFLGNKTPSRQQFLCPNCNFVITQMSNLTTFFEAYKTIIEALKKETAIREIQKEELDYISQTPEEPIEEPSK